MKNRKLNFFEKLFFMRMIYKKIEETVDRLKTYTNSLAITHLLLCNLSNLLLKEPILSIKYSKDNWFRILILTCLSQTSESYKSTIRKQLQYKQLENQLLKFIKENRNASSKIFTYKLKFIFYYIKYNLKDCNKFLVFEALNLKKFDFFRCSIFIEAIKIPNKLNEQFVSISLKDFLESENQSVLVKLIPSLIETDKIVEINYAHKSEFFIEKAMESLMIYAKYTKNISLFKKMLDKENKKRFKDFVTNGYNLCNISEYLNYAKINELENKIDFTNILREEFEICKDKKQFLQEIKNFLNEYDEEFLN